MKTPITLSTFAASLGLSVVAINYNARGSKFRGYDLVSANKAIQVSFEPVHYSNGDKWMVTDKTQTVFGGVRYIKSMRAVPSLLHGLVPAEHTGFSLR